MLHTRAHPLPLIEKTPGRSVLKGRAGLQENLASPVKKQQPLGNGNLKSGTAKQSALVTTARPLVDKTPFRNRVALRSPLQTTPVLKPKVTHEAAAQKASVEEDDDGEIEYMAPTAICT